MLDLCSGIGGFSLAGRWAGYTTVGFCEIDPFCQSVLAKNFPGAPIHDDLKTLTGDVVRGWLGREGIVELITGGYPCQPFSLAGKRLGAADDRHLWPFIAALVADLQPRRCLFENVYGHVSMGLDDVLADLESLGYACGAIVVPAAAVGAPHRRDRVWICGQRIDYDAISTCGHAWQELGGGSEHVPDANQGGWGAREPDLYAGESDVEGRGVGSNAAPRGVRRGEPSWDERQTALDGEGDFDGEALGGVGESPDGLSGRLAQPGWRVGPDILNPWAGDWEAGCPRIQESEPDRINKLKALGNAIVPQVAYAILSIWDESEAAA